MTINRNLNEPVWQDTLPGSTDQFVFTISEETPIQQTFDTIRAIDSDSKVR